MTDATTEATTPPQEAQEEPPAGEVLEADEAEVVAELARGYLVPAEAKRKK